MKKLFFLLITAGAVFIAAAQKTNNGKSQDKSAARRTLMVTVKKPGPAISPRMWGIFFEDINFGADGGLYAELIKNGSFEFPAPLMGWRQGIPEGAGSLLIVNRSAADESNPRYAEITLNGKGEISLTNEGFRGIGLHKEEPYEFTFYAKLINGSAAVRAELLNAAGNPVGFTMAESLSGDWKKYSIRFTATDTAQKGKCRIVFSGNGKLQTDRFSLFPVHTWKDQPAGLRRDLVEKLAALKPGFLRFPGGCIVEGKELANRYQWKTTVGNPEERKLIMNRWNVEFRHRPAPDYFQSFGLGFYEYFRLAEDLGAAPLPILNCGMACQFNSGEVAALDEVDPYIQDALDLVEFANGDVSTKWGRLRAAMGHPAPFNLQMIGVGNEQWDAQYLERYKLFEQVLKKKHPEIELIAAAGPYAEGKLFDYAWKEFRQLRPDYMDEHYYKSPEWFFSNAGRYDNYDRNSIKIFAGEYAAHSKEDVQAESRNTWLSALAEAAFMTGLERNADIVKMCSYAPLLAHVDAWQWRPDLIWFDNLQSVATPNYYVQQLYALNRGTHVVPALFDGKPLSGKDSLYASAVIDSASSELIIKLVNAGDQPQELDILPEGIRPLKGNLNLVSLSAQGLLDYNALDKPALIRPVQSTQALKGKKFAYTLAPRSFSVLRMKYEK